MTKDRILIMDLHTCLRVFYIVHAKKPELAHEAFNWCLEEIKRKPMKKRKNELEIPNAKNNQT
jgi:hypothetical protein